MRLAAQFSQFSAALDGWSQLRQVMACRHVVALGDPQVGNGLAYIGMLELILTRSCVLGGLKVSCLLEDGEEIGVASGSFGLIDSTFR